MKSQITFTEEFAKRFKKSYHYKMGGSQTIVFPNGQSFFFNDKEYYSSRGARYNASIKHDEIGEVIISKKEVSAQIKLIKEREKQIKATVKKEKESKKRYNENKANGIYGIANYEYGSFIELSREEMMNRTFDAVRIAKTLDISIEDAKLINSEGKTYVFAKQLSTGKIIELYHSSLDCNYLSISISYPSDERIAEFNNKRSDWVNAPYAALLGQTLNKNHFVC